MSAMTEEQSEHLLIWEFRVRPGREAEFEEVYGPQGAWAKLFDSAQGYLGTQLLVDPEGERRYLTVDRWASAAAFQRFRELRAAEYEALDARCAGFTDAETPLGAFRVVRAARRAP